MSEGVKICDQESEKWNCENVAIMANVFWVFPNPFHEMVYTKPLYKTHTSKICVGPRHETKNRHEQFSNKSI